MITDFVTIARFYKEGRFGFAAASLGVVVFTICILLLLAYAQNRKRGAARVRLQWLLVLSLLKPAMDAYNVINQTEVHSGDIFSAFTEMFISKVIEL